MRRRHGSPDRHRAGHPILPVLAPVLALALALALGGCAGTPPPDWQMNAKSSMDRFLDAYLTGQQRIESLEIAKAREEVSRTGRTDLLARLELLRCAARVASLEFDDCPAYAALQADAAPPERAYAAFLKGQAGAAGSGDLLPEPQRAIARIADVSAADPATVQAIGDPLSRLVAAGVLLRGERLHPGVIGVAVDTASAQGWRRPLLAWLGVALQRAERVGDAPAAERLRRRIAIAEQRVAD